MMESLGKVIQVTPMSSGVGAQSGKEWHTQGFVIETHDQYPRKQYFEIYGKERIEKNLPSVDEEVTVSFELESREYQGRWYTSARAWKVEKGSAKPVAAQPIPSAASVPQPPQTQTTPSNPMDGNTKLPF